jgi:hypothetical protein
MKREFLNIDISAKPREFRVSRHRFSKIARGMTAVVCGVIILVGVPIISHTVPMFDSSFSTSVADVSLKATHHHYPGFYSKTILPMVLPDRIVVVNGKTYPLLEKKLVNYHFDTEDVIIDEQNTIVENHDKFKDKTLVYNSAGQVISLITKRHDEYYPIVNGFTTTTAHLTNVSTVTIRHRKEQPIAYADKLFANKSDLVQFLQKPADTENKLRHLIIYALKETTDFILYSGNRNIFILRFRSALADISCEEFNEDGDRKIVH